MNKKNILILIIVLVFSGIAFMYLTRNNTINDVSSLSTNTTTAAPSADAQYIYSLLQRMSVVKLDDSIFSSDAFRSLIDNTVVLTTQQTGRNNPFSPIGTDAKISIQSTTTKSSR